MTKLDIYVYRLIHKAYNQGYLDGADGDCTANNFEELLDELICPEYAELSHEPSILAAGLDPETEHDPDPEE